MQKLIVRFGKSFKPGEKIDLVMDYTAVKPGGRGEGITWSRDDRRTFGGLGFERATWTHQQGFLTSSDQSRHPSYQARAWCEAKGWYASEWCSSVGG